MAVEHGAGFFSDAHNWVLISTLIFVFFAIKKGKAPLTEMLDKRSVQIENDLNEAEKLRVEAQELLADYQRKHRDAIKTADQIIEQAKDQIELIREEADQKLENALARREKQLLERINRAEIAAMQEVRDQAADMAARAARKLVTDILQDNASNLVDQSIDGISKDLKKIA